MGWAGPAERCLSTLPATLPSGWIVASVLRAWLALALSLGLGFACSSCLAGADSAGGPVGPTVPRAALSAPPASPAESAVPADLHLATCWGADSGRRASHVAGARGASLAEVSDLFITEEEAGHRGSCPSCITGGACCLVCHRIVYSIFRTGGVCVWGSAGTVCRWHLSGLFAPP